MNYIYKITRYLIIISIVVLTFYLSYLKQNTTIFGETLYNNNIIDESVSDSSIVDVDKESIYEFDEPIENILIDDKYSIYVGNRYSYVVDEKIIFMINDIVIDFIYFNNKFYFISNDTLYLYDNNNLQKEVLGKYLYDFFITNKTIYLCGELDNDAVIYEYSVNLEYIDEAILGGSGYECFKSINYYNNKIYLIGEKDSTSFYSPFKNCGVNNTVKTFMITFDDNIIDEVYFNITNKNELFKDVIYDEYIYLVLSTNDIICLDYNLNIIPINKNRYPINNLILSINKELLIFKYKDNNLYLNNQLFYQAPFKILKISLKSGYLTIYLIDDYNIIEQVLFEYHIDKNDDLIISKYNYDLNTLNNLEVNSYFEVFKKEIKEYDPYLQKQLDGIYNIKYLITRTNNSTFLIDGRLIIKHYVNIINDGIYKVNKELNFFGKALLNNKEIYNGYIINEPGNYELILEDINNVKRIYKFKVIKNYYLDDPTVTFNADYNISQNSNMEIMLDIDNIDLENIDKIIVNNQEFNNYKINNNYIYLNITGKSYYSIDTYEINKIILKNNQEIIINKLITVKTINTLPSIILNQSSKLGKINLNYEILDESKTIMCLRTDIVENDKVINSYYNYFNNQEINYNEIKENSVIKQYLLINNGIEIEELLICEYKTSAVDINKLQAIYYKLDLSLNNLSIDLETTNVKYDYLNVENNNLISSIEIISALINYKTIIILSGSLFLITFIYILIRKKIKNKKLNQLK